MERTAGCSAALVTAGTPVEDSHGGTRRASATQVTSVSIARAVEGTPDGDISVRPWIAILPKSDLA